MRVLATTVHVLVAALASLATHAAPQAAQGYVIEQLVPGSAFKGVHGLGVDAEDRLVAGSVVGQTVYDVDVSTGAVKIRIGAPEGEADDMVFLPDGTMVYTSILQNEVRAQKPNGEVITLVPNIVSVNSIAYDERKRRLYVAQVFGGDAVWEIDPQGEKPPRNIVKDVGGFNGFDIGPDGMLYGPLWFKQRVVRIDPDEGTVTTVADGFGTPAAANFDSKWNLYVLDTARGEVVRVDRTSGRKTVVAQLKSSLDNLAIDSKDRIYVSNMADNTIHEVNAATGEARPVVPGGLSAPLGLAVHSDGKKDLLYVADVFAYRMVDGENGGVHDIHRMWAEGSPLAYPVAVSLSGDTVVLLSESGTVQAYDRKTDRPLRSWSHLRGATSAFLMPDGKLLVADASKGTLSKMAAEGSAPEQLAADLGSIGGVAYDGSQVVYYSEAARGEVVRLDLASGSKRVIAKGLTNPRAIALTPSGGLVVIELGARKMTLIDLNSGEHREIARELPIGFLGTGASALPVGLAVGAQGTVYFTSDVENAIYKLHKQ